jgi:hypothetical protein
LSLIRASCVVKRQSMVVAAVLRAAVQAANFRSIVARVPNRQFRPWRARTLDAISAMFSQEPGLGV